MPQKRKPAPAEALDGRVRLLFGYAGRSIFSMSYLISRFGLAVGGWSHVMPILSDGTALDSYEDMIIAPDGGWKTPGFPDVIPAGVRHRPPPSEYYPGVRTQLVEIPVSHDQETEWERWLWDKLDDAYDMSAINGFLEGRDLHRRKEYICSALGAGSLKAIDVLGGPIPDHEFSPDGLYTAVVSPRAIGAFLL